MGVPSFPVIRPGGEPLPEELQGVAALAAAATTGFVVRTGEATYAARPAAIADIEGLSDVLDAFASLPDPTGQNGLYLTVSGDQYVLGIGTPGEPGLSAYQVALANGFTGTETEWLDSLKGDTGPNEITAGTSTPIEGALAGHGGFVRAALASDLPAHTHGDLVTLGTAQTVTGAKTFTATVAAPRVDVGTTSILTGQGGPALLAVRYSDSPVQYPYFALRVAGGTEADPQDVQAGRWSGGFLAYARFRGAYQGVGSVVAQVTDASGDFLRGRLAFQVNSGADGGANFTALSLDSTAITLYRPTEVRGELAVVDPATSLKLRVVPQGPAEPTFQFQIGSTPAFGVRSNARTQFNTGMELNPSGTFRVGTSDCPHGMRRGSSAWLELDDFIAVRVRALTTSYQAGHGVELAGPGTVGRYVRRSAGQTADLDQYLDSDGTTVLSAVRADGSHRPAHLADSAAANDSLYYSTDQSKLAYKDPSGTVHPLY